MPLHRLPLPALALMVAAPFLAVAIGLYLFHSAWLTVLLYHFQIAVHALWVRRRLAVLRDGWSVRWLLFLGLPAALPAPALLLLLEEVLRPDIRLNWWLGQYGLSGPALPAFVLYYGLLHPVFEQFHWDALRRDPRLGALAHLLFAGYHVPVLVLLLRPGWVAVSFVILLCASMVWARVRERLGGLCIPALSHVIVDVAIIGTVYLIALS